MNMARYPVVVGLVLCMGAQVGLLFVLGALARLRGVFATQNVVAVVAAAREDPVNLIAAQLIVFLPIIAWLKLHARDGTLRNPDADDPATFASALRLRPVSTLTFVLAFVGGAFAQLPLTEIANLTAELAPIPIEVQLRTMALLSGDHPLRLALVFLALVLVAPLCEELLFRGGLLPHFERRHGKRTAMIACAALFALCHAAHIPAVVATFAAGLALSVIALETRSTFVSIAFHAGVNTVPCLLGATKWSIAGLNVASRSPTHIPLALTLIAATSAIVFTTLACRNASRVT